MHATAPSTAKTMTNKTIKSIFGNAANAACAQGTRERAREREVRNANEKVGVHESPQDCYEAEQLCRLSGNWKLFRIGQSLRSLRLRRACRCEGPWTRGRRNARFGPRMRRACSAFSLSLSVLKANNVRLESTAHRNADPPDSFGPAAPLSLFPSSAPSRVREARSFGEAHQQIPCSERSESGKGQQGMGWTV
jgi:hypothetical protein